MPPPASAPAAPVRAPARAPRAGRAAPGPAGRALRHAVPALTGYLLVRLLGLLVLAVWAGVENREVWSELTAQWDSLWYLGIADHGYDSAVRIGGRHSNLAFFPLYPALIALADPLLPGSPASAGLWISVAASPAAAWGVFAVGDRLGGRRTGTALAVLWGAAPVAAVQWTGYTESLFTALAAWSLYALLTDRWLWAGTLASLAGLTRPTGAAVTAAVVVAAAVLLWRLGGDRRAARGDRGPRPGRVLAGALLAPLGWLGYVGWVGLRLGRWDGYFAVQRDWRNVWDGGAATVEALGDILFGQPRPQLFLAVVSAVLVVAPVLYALCVAARQPLALLVFSGVLLLIVLGSGGVYFPRARFLLPAFPLLLPAASALAAARPRTARLVLSAAALVSAYLGAYMLLVFPGPP